LSSWSGTGTLAVTISTALGLYISEERDWIGVGMVMETYSYYFCCYYLYEVKAVSYAVYNSASI
jgi:hypothetical protein